MTPCNFVVPSIPAKDGKAAHVPPVFLKQLLQHLEAVDPNAALVSRQHNDTSDKSAPDISTNINQIPLADMDSISVASFLQHYMQWKELEQSEHMIVLVNLTFVYFSQLQHGLTGKMGTKIFLQWLKHVNIRCDSYNSKTLDTATEGFFIHEIAQYSWNNAFAQYIRDRLHAHDNEQKRSCPSFFITIYPMSSRASACLPFMLNAMHQMSIEFVNH